MTTHYRDYETAAKKIITRVGKIINLGIPLGIGKPIGLVNAFYRLAIADPTLQLTIITGLTLARPILHTDLEKRFLEPILERLLKDYEDPLYEQPRQLQQLPANIKVIEFFLAPGEYLHNATVQQNYISSKYTSVIQDSKPYNINVYAHQVAPSHSNTNEYSISSNTDLFHGMLQSLKECNFEKKAIVAEINANLPFMPGAVAIVQSEIFTDIIDTGHYHALFALPRDKLSPQDHLIGLYTSALIKDDSCLQIGIGKLSNAVANALIMRHKNNAIYRDLLQQLNVTEKFGQTITAHGALDIFAKGLYASSEMISDEFLQLYNESILKKRVYDNIGLQKLLNNNDINENITPIILDILIKNNLIQTKLTSDDFAFLQQFGILKPELRYQIGNLILPSGELLPADLDLPQVKQQIINQYLGSHLKSGKIIHAGFFIGSVEFYAQLRKLDPKELAQIEMTSIARTNSLLWSYELSQLQRQKARFINSAMMVTLGGSLVSDGLKNLQEVSGVGGQFDFVNMAQNLVGARSIMNCHSVRTVKGKTSSNIIWDYPNLTIPRYLRDIFITEYGIADCRSKIDSEVIKAILNITDSRFQEKLLTQAKKYGKISQNYKIPPQFQKNYPEIIIPIIQEFQLKGYCNPYPFGSDLTDIEKILANALLFLNNCGKLRLLWLLGKAFLFFTTDTKFTPYLVRLKLDKPTNLKEFTYKKLLKYTINQQLIHS